MIYHVIGLVFVDIVQGVEDAFSELLFDLGQIFRITK